MASHSLIHHLEINGFSCVHIIYLGIGPHRDRRRTHGVTVTVDRRATVAPTCKRRDCLAGCIECVRWRVKASVCDVSRAAVLGGVRQILDNVRYRR